MTQASEWVSWIHWGAPEVARRIKTMDTSPIRRPAPVISSSFCAMSPARDTVIALAQDAARVVREREALHRGVLRAGIARLSLEAGCQFLAATAAEVERADFDTLWGTGLALTHLLARCDQVEGLAAPVRVMRGLADDRACPACGHTVVMFDGTQAKCLRCHEEWLPLQPLLTLSDGS